MFCGGLSLTVNSSNSNSHNNNNSLSSIVVGWFLVMSPSLEAIYRGSVSVHCMNTSYVHFQWSTFYCGDHRHLKGKCLYCQLPMFLDLVLPPAALPNIASKIGRQCLADSNIGVLLASFSSTTELSNLQMSVRLQCSAASLSNVYAQLMFAQLRKYSITPGVKSNKQRSV